MSPTVLVKIYDAYRISSRWRRNDNARSNITLPDELIKNAAI